MSSAINAEDKPKKLMKLKILQHFDLKSII